MDKYSYDAKHIRILNEEEVAALFGLKKVEELKVKYKQVPLLILNRILEASALTRIDPELALKRYIEGDKRIALVEEFETVYNDLVNAHHRGGGRSCRAKK